MAFGFLWTCIRDRDHEPVGKNKEEAGRNRRRGANPSLDQPGSAIRLPTLSEGNGRPAEAETSTEDVEDGPEEGTEENEAAGTDTLEETNLIVKVYDSQ